MTNTNQVREGPVRTERIPQHVLDSLLSNVSLIDLIDQSTSIIHSDNKTHTALCPFHISRSREKTLNISIEKNRFSCSECGFKGSAIGWLMFHDGLSFQDAVIEMSERTGIDVSSWITYDSVIAARANKQSLLMETAEFYKEQLESSEVAQGYVLARRLSPDTINRYNVGFAPGNSTAHSKYFEKRSRQLWNQGLSVRLSNGAFEKRFRNRLMFPIRNVEGITVGYGGRSLTDDKPKYLNSPSSPSFNKSSILYGLYESLQIEPKPDRLILVEGYIDVLTLSQHGITGVVATLGTAPSSSHIKTVFEHTECLIACFDSDAAGLKAAERLLHAALPHLLNKNQLKFAMQPVGYDPDSFVNEYGPNAFNELVNKAVNADVFLHHTLTRGLDLSGIGGKAMLAASARPIVETIMSSELRQQMVDRIEDSIGVPWFDIDND